jgi:hypothetical protein
MGEALKKTPKARPERKIFVIYGAPSGVIA